ncbi:hypothetical protein P0Y35_02045 [Kiritimatiellaeota bacterium B1221]|nr:hypothetical protein [Kiritimatiellaeota bacterium B1221]
MQSPLKRFHSLKQGDPQSVAFTAVFLFLVSVCWFSWTYLFPPKDESLPLGRGRFENQIPLEAVSLSDVLEVHRVFQTPEDIPNPFYRKPPQKPSPKPPKENSPNPNSQANPTVRNSRGAPKPNPPAVKRPTGSSPRVATRPQPPPAAAPKTQPLTLTYRGLLKRPDQSTVALVAITESGSQKFLTVGDKIPPFTVNQITAERVQIQRGSGPVIFLPRGKPQQFEVPL